MHIGRIITVGVLAAGAYRAYHQRKGKSGPLVKNSGKVMQL